MMHGNHYPEMSVADFMSKYLPHNEVFDNSKHETTIDLTEASGKDGHFICKDISDWPDSSLMAEVKMRSNESCEDGEFFTSEGFSPSALSSDFRYIDVAMYRTRAEDGRPCGKLWEDKAKGRSKHAAHNFVSHTAIFGEIKLQGIGCERDKDVNHSQTQVGIDVRGQLWDDATEILIRQHRTFLFTFSVYRTTAYLMRWDRLGVIISEPIDLKKEAEQFYEFFFRLRKATDVELGLDPTATIINVNDIDEDADTGYELHPSIVAVMKAIDALPEAAARVKPHISRAFNEGSWPYYELRVPDKAELAKMRRFLVRNLATYSNLNSPLGRSAKGYIAFDLDTQKFRFLKDSWRTDSPGVHPEMEVYEKLSSVSPRIPGIASVCCGGDLSDHLGVKQVTRTQEHVPVYHPRIHTRIVLNEVGIPLEEYTDSRELCYVVTDAFVAHAGAWKCSKVLHRDVSDGNIVIYIDYDSTPDADGSARGLLIDWDLCKYQHELNGGNAQHSRSGTWRFLSAALLNFPLKPHELADDIEAFYHLLCLYAYRFHSPMSELNVANIVKTVYDTCEIVQGYWLGSMVKYTNMEKGVHPEVDGPFGQLLGQIAEIVKEHYAGLDHALEQYALPHPAIPPANRASTQSSRLISESRSLKIDEENAAFMSMIRDPSKFNPIIPKAVPLPSPSAVSPDRLPLATHEALYSLLNTHATQNTPDHKWDPHDKFPDQFALINWSPFVRSKRRWDMGGVSVVRQ
ncbi:hypothetical protein BXZ70DRAFT_939991 [Cristinia sonorae]|uniref:Fungal-type protein kinase domain-containing protein n=1 Tax=Cristinia sonorae TaxID=1940300 RepID=A0A8K0UPM5_9AGAR|nr:hypothetical protein BXZ70DRAFT_939991 [Cristinia sonorae]